MDDDAAAMKKNGKRATRAKANKKDQKAKQAKANRIDNATYEKELKRLHVELVKMQEWVKTKGLKVVLVFEGRDAAGKGGTIKRITEPLNPRVASVVALPAPTEREKTQWYFQRYVQHLPAAGEIVILDRSWYNRAGVERVMGFCTNEEYIRFMYDCPEFERMLVRSGITLIKYWFSVSDEEQERRFQSRLKDPTKRWKLSPMDLESRNRWVDYSEAKDRMMQYTDIPEAPWYVVNSDVKKHARLNCVAHLLTLIPYEDLTPEPLTLATRPPQRDYIRPPRDQQKIVPEIYPKAPAKA
ncbi:polyphosphate kinase 2 [uncultured Thiohalocapsa sp.]|uniref:polyphosphate kinase 2 n=1 Tax=uncultured Thiohalocapsa sp. TaxID=768990 RepID=UPI0025E8AE47|nr:polyphosphate kinase 2 [uncultured Thiohalocapsa sp.]